jgi:L-asparagine permease
VPYAGIALTACFTVAGVFMNLVVPSEAFNIAPDLSALGIIASWGTMVRRGILQRPSFHVTALMSFENYWNLVALVVIVPALVGGW